MWGGRGGRGVHGVVVRSQEEPSGGRRIQGGAMVGSQGQGGDMGIGGLGAAGTRGIVVSWGSSGGTIDVTLFEFCVFFYLFKEFQKTQ